MGLNPLQTQEGIGTRLPMSWVEPGDYYRKGMQQPCCERKERAGRLYAEGQHGHLSLVRLWGYKCQSPVGILPQPCWWAPEYGGRQDLYYPFHFGFPLSCLGLTCWLLL